MTIISLLSSALDRLGAEIIPFVLDITNDNCILMDTIVKGILITALAKASWESHPLRDLPQTAQFGEEFKTEVSLSPLPIIADQSESRSDDCAKCAHRLRF